MDLCLQVELELELGVLFILERRRLENMEENLRSKDDWEGLQGPTGSKPLTL